MKFNSSLLEARKKRGMSQEEVAEKLGVTRQTISKWELGETVPDIYQSKKMAELYHLTLDELIEVDWNLKEIEEIIVNSDEKKDEKINWTNAWGKKYPILISYQEEVDSEYYAKELSKLLDEMKETYNYSELDAMLVLKDILAQVYKARK